MGEAVSQVSPQFSDLVRRRELSLVAPTRHAEVAEQLDDSIMRPLLDEQLRECIFNFAQLAQPTGTRIVSDNGLDPVLAYALFTDIPVLPQDRAEAEELACDEFRRLAALDDESIPGAALTLCPNGEVTLRPVMQMRMIIR